MATAGEIRSRFLNYFNQCDHQIVDSSPLVPDNDPTLLFVNSGMVQFKNNFTGQESSAYPRAVTAQKCLRAGGKHNDLENVGYTARHHTFFEMLGNFSFGDYFKDQAIHHAWQMVTKELGLDKNKLLVTVYSDDDDAAQLWRKIAGLPEDRIIRISTSDNFWQMGDSGPCGPCSEIFYDHGDHIFGGPPGSADEDGDRFIEIWNLVFMQYEQLEPGQRIPLPRPSIDTGMGLERIAAVLQGKHNNYDVDHIRALIMDIADKTNQDADGDLKTSHRVIADHLRAAAFLIADGVLPANEGRGYVLRRIMRRGMRHANMLGAEVPLMYQLVDKLTETMGGHYHELMHAEALIKETLKLEEERFISLLERGLGLLNLEVDKLGDCEGLPGNVAFKLYDTFGFPLDLTQDIMRGQDRSVDVAGFDKAMNQQRARARSAWSGSGDSGVNKLWLKLADELGASEFLGYNSTKAQGVVKGLVYQTTAKLDKKTDGHNQTNDFKSVETLHERKEGIIIANQTPFYAEAGGQVGDQGQIMTSTGALFQVTDTKKIANGMIMHIGHVIAGHIHKDDELTLEVDGVRRKLIKANHSVTHLVHAALRQRLGDHVAQKGSLVGSKFMRFDFSHNYALSAEDIAAVEDQVNEEILANTKVLTRSMTFDQAKTVGAMALFGEKYGDEVRVVSMGQMINGVQDDDQVFSVELCGGTHVNHTGDIGGFKIIQEQSTSAGVRRIECITGPAIIKKLNQYNRFALDIARLLKVNEDQVLPRLEKLLGDKRDQERQIKELQKRLVQGDGKDGGGEKIEDIGGVSFLGQVTSDLPGNELKSLVDEFKQKNKSGVIALISTLGGKATLVVGVGDDLKDRIDAVPLVKSAAIICGGKGGGGRADMAQAGGPDGSKAAEAIAHIRNQLVEISSR